MDSQATNASQFKSRKGRITSYRTKKRNCIKEFIGKNIGYTRNWWQVTGQIATQFIGKTIAHHSKELSQLFLDGQKVNGGNYRKTWDKEQFQLTLNGRPISMVLTMRWWLCCGQSFGHIQSLKGSLQMSWEGVARRCSKPCRKHDLYAQLPTAEQDEGVTPMSDPSTAFNANHATNVLIMKST